MLFASPKLARDLCSLKGTCDIGLQGWLARSAAFTTFATSHAASPKVLATDLLCACTTTLRPPYFPFRPSYIFFGALPNDLRCCFPLSCSECEYDCISHIRLCTSDPIFKMQKNAKYAKCKTCKICKITRVSRALCYLEGVSSEASHSQVALVPDLGTQNTTFLIQGGDSDRAWCFFGKV